MKTLPTAGLIVVKNNKLLLAFSKNKKAWYLPGGKIDAGETSLQAIKREIAEELALDLADEKLKYYYHISALAYGENPPVTMEQDCFIYDMEEEIKPSNEIEDVKYFSLEMYKLEPVQVVGVITAFEKLHKDKILV